MADIEVGIPAAGPWPSLIKSVLVAAAPHMDVGRSAELAIALEAAAAWARAAGAEQLRVRAMMEPAELHISIDAVDADRPPPPHWGGSLAGRLLDTVAQGVDTSHPSRLTFHFRI